MWIGMRALALVLGMIIVGCGSGSGDNDPDPLEATWIGTDVKLVAANGSWNQYEIPNNKEVQRGTYTYSGNTITAIISTTNTIMFDGPDTWVDYADLSEEYKGYLGGTDIVTFAITNDSFTINGQIFIISPNFNGSWTHIANIPGTGDVTITNVINGSDVTIKMAGDDFQKGTFAFSSKKIFMKITHEWMDGTWKPVDWDEDVTLEYVLNGNNLTLSNGLVDGEEPSEEKGKNLPLFEGTWTRQ
jgi:hypothetical protein